MKVTETIERDCCDPNKDLEPYLGILSAAANRFSPEFCIQCGQIWVTSRRMDAAGSSEDYLRPIDISDLCF
jgi:hypothetical protein